MPGIVSLENRLPALWQTSPAPQVGVSAEPATAVAASERPEPLGRPVNLAVSHIIMNAESLIASVTGLKPQQVHLSVNLARYEF